MWQPALRSEQRHNVGSSFLYHFHSRSYGFWYRSLEHPDGISGQELIENNIDQCPMYTPIGLFYGNVAHSTRRHGLKLSDYFPALEGGRCASPTFGNPVTFADFVPLSVALRSNSNTTRGCATLAGWFQQWPLWYLG